MTSNVDTCLPCQLIISIELHRTIEGVCRGLIRVFVVNSGHLMAILDVKYEYIITLEIIEDTSLFSVSTTRAVALVHVHVHCCCMN